MCKFSHFFSGPLSFKKDSLFIESTVRLIIYEILMLNVEESVLMTAFQNFYLQVIYLFYMFVYSIWFVTISCMYACFLITLISASPFVSHSCQHPCFLKNPFFTSTSFHFVLRSTEFNQGFLCNHEFGSVWLSLVGSPMSTWPTVKILSLPQSLSSQ